MKDFRQQPPGCRSFGIFLKPVIVGDAALSIHGFNIGLSPLSIFFRYFLEKSQFGSSMSMSFQKSNRFISI